MSSTQKIERCHFCIIPSHTHPPNRDCDSGYTMSPSLFPLSVSSTTYLAMPDPPQSRYVPPHLRNRPASSSSSSPSHAAPATSSQRGYDRRSTPSRAPWGPSSGPAGRSSGYANDSPGPSQASYGVAEGSRTPGRNAQSAPTRPGQSYGVGRGVGGGSGGGVGGGSPSLYVFGDSFVGPMKLLSDDCASVRTFKGASAKVRRVFQLA
jgi:hypothetical protein